MLTALIAVAAIQTPVEFKLPWAKGQTFTYEVGVDSPFGKATGTWQLTVSAADEKTLTITWPEVKMTGNMRPMPAGTQKLTKQGVISGPLADASMYFIPMHLPEKAAKPSDTYTTKFALPNGTVELTGTFAKLDGAKAHFSAKGKMNIEGQAIDALTESVYDTARGVFLSGKFSMPATNTTFTLALVEKRAAMTLASS